MSTNDKPAEEPKATPDSIVKAKSAINNAYNTAARKRTTDAARLSDSVMTDVLLLPLDEIAAEMLESEVQLGSKEKNLTIEQRVSHQNGLIEFQERIDKAVDFAKSYITRMAKDHDGLDNEALAKMTKDSSMAKPSYSVDLFISRKHPKLIEAYLYAIGSSGKSGDMVVAKDGNMETRGAIDTIIRYLNTNFEKKGDIMPYVWSVLYFMSEKDRKEIAEKFCLNNPAKLHEFLTEGNKIGVYTWAEIDALNKTLTEPKQYTTKEIAQFHNNWKQMNDFMAEAEKNGIIAYGTDNQAGKGITLVNIGLSFIQVGAAFTIFANFMTGAWQGGTWKGIGQGIKRLTNASSLTAALVAGSAELFKSEKRLSQILAGTNAKAQAARDLQKEKNGNDKFPAWRTFFEQKDAAGVFFAFVQHAKNDSKPPETDLSKLAGYLIPANFENYLDRQTNDKTDGKGIDYAAIKESFREIHAEELFSFAKIFDTLNIGGADKDARENFVNWTDSPAKMLPDVAPATAAATAPAPAPASALAPAPAPAGDAT